LMRSSISYMQNLSEVGDTEYDSGPALGCIDAVTDMKKIRYGSVIPGKFRQKVFHRDRVSSKLGTFDIAFKCLRRGCKGIYDLSLFNLKCICCLYGWKR
jgi:hypothetical protein